MAGGSFDLFSEETPRVLCAVNDVFASKNLEEFKFYRTDQLAIVQNGGAGIVFNAATDVPGDTDTTRRLPQKQR